MILPLVGGVIVSGETSNGVIVGKFGPQSVIAEDSCMWTADAIMTITLGAV